MRGIRPQGIIIRFQDLIGALCGTALQAGKSRV